MRTYLYQKFFYDRVTYYWREAFDYLPPKEVVFAPLFGDCEYYRIKRNYPMGVIRADGVEYHGDVGTNEQIKGMWS